MELTWLLLATCLLTAVVDSTLFTGLSYGKCPVGKRLIVVHGMRMCVGMKDCPRCVPYYQCKITHADANPLYRKCPEPTEVCCKSLPTDEAGGWANVSQTDSREAAYGEFPWMVVILKQWAPEAWTRSQYVAGGSIIHPSAVITVAHRLLDLEDVQMKVRAGELTRTKPEPYPYQERPVASFHTHEDYGRLYLSNDVGLVFLKEPLDLSAPGVGAVVLGRGAPSGSERCVATGWGRLAFGLDYADTLKKVRAPLVLNRQLCLFGLRARRPRAVLHSTQLCAGGVAGEDTCTGDGGSPLVCPIRGNASVAQWGLYGLAAWGAGCGADGVPSVYVDVSQFYSWIRKSLDRHV